MSTFQPTMPPIASGPAAPAPPTDLRLTHGSAMEATGKIPGGFRVDQPNGGSSGLKAFQQFFADKGSTIKPDGLFGPKTLTVLRGMLAGITPEGVANLRAALGDEAIRSLIAIGRSLGLDTSRLAAPGPGEGGTNDAGPDAGSMTKAPFAVSKAPFDAQKVGPKVSCPLGPGPTPKPEIKTGPVKPTQASVPGTLVPNALTKPVDLEASLVAQVISPDAADRNVVGMLDIKVDAKQAMTSWKEFPAFLKRLHDQQIASGGKPVVLDLSLHGNHGTGFKLVSEKGGVLTASIASAAWINEQIRAAGFSPKDITLVSEACNGGNAYLTTVDGFSASEKAKASKYAQADAAKKKLSSTIEFVDIQQPPGSPIKPDRSLTWIGRPNGTNKIGTVLLQYASGVGVPGRQIVGSVSTSLKPHGGVTGLGKDGHLVSVNTMTSASVSDRDTSAWAIQDEHVLAMAKSFKSRYDEGDAG